jgi:hypothetical protein
MSETKIFGVECGKEENSDKIDLSCAGAEFDYGLKFVAFQTESGKKIIGLLNVTSGVEHITLARRIEGYLEKQENFKKFLGAGMIKSNSKEAEFGSPSCCEKSAYGYDRPEDWEEGIALLKNVRDAVLRLLKLQEKKEN